ncbi:MAG: DUF1972 domain-containing protein [Bacteroidia bacterium]|jgi:glycosyltransferase involved in cell wall biosynthesis|nr:DUF1972 domain-containing protein [Bacteroidia bacterium]
MKVAIIGTRGIPNHYGGFEQLAEYLSVALHNKGFEITVYNSSLHPFQNSSYKGVRIITCKDFEDRWGTAGQFIYDLNCILHSRKENYDVIIQLGYTSSSIWWFLLPSSAKIVTNMDGLEWKRSKYSWPVKLFLHLAEFIAVFSSDALVADSVGIASYIKNKFRKDSHYIAYGANIFKSPDASVLNKYQLSPFAYYLIIARLEPENNIETIIKGYLKSDKKFPLVIVGGLNKYGAQLKNKYNNPGVIFLGSIYQLDELNQLRYHCTLYFHGHTVGGTNPSLLEAMAAHAFIVAHDNVFNRSVLMQSAKFFVSDDDIAALINEEVKEEQRKLFTEFNAETITKNYSWPFISDKYEHLLNTIIK